MSFQYESSLIAYFTSIQFQVLRWKRGKDDETNTLSYECIAKSIWSGLTDRCLLLATLGTPEGPTILYTKLCLHVYVCIFLTSVFTAFIILLKSIKSSCSKENAQNYCFIGFGLQFEDHHIFQ